MEKFTTLTAVAAPLPMINVDTAMLIPQRFRKPVIGLGRGGADQGVAQAESLEQIEQFLRAVL